MKFTKKQRFSYLTKGFQKIAFVFKIQSSQSRLPCPRGVWWPAAYPAEQMCNGTCAPMSAPYSSGTTGPGVYPPNAEGQILS